MTGGVLCLAMASSDALWQALGSGMLTGGLYALLGLGMALIFGVMRVINLAHGQLLMVGMYLTHILAAAVGMNPYLTIVVTVPALFILGYALEWVLIGPVSRADTILPHSQVLLTVGIGMVLTDTALLVFSGNYRSVPTELAARSVTCGPVTLNQAGLLAFGLTAVVATGLWALLTHTDFGRSMRATAQNRPAAETLGLHTARIRALTYGLGAALTGAAATLFVPLYYLYPAVGDTFTTKAFIVTVLGGMGSIPGAILGGLLLGVGEAVGATLLGMDWRDMVGLGLFVTVLVLRPAGLGGRSSP